MSASAPPVNNRQVLAIAVPIVISNTTIPILGAVDTAVIGQLGLAAPIGAVGIGAVILSGLYWIFGFLRMGTTGLVAQAVGAGDGAEATALLMRGLLIGVAGALVCITLQGPLFWVAFALAPASPEVSDMARQYLAIRIWGAPAAISLFAITGWLIAVRRTRAVLVLQLLMNGLNVVLNFWFVLGLGWGVGGVATATLIAEWSGLALGLWLCRDALTGGRWRDWARIFDRLRLLRLAQVNGDILVRSVLLEAAIIAFMFQAAGLGDVPLAANQILLQFLTVTAYALDGFAFSAEALVGAATGARAPGALRRAAILSSQWAAGAALALAAGFALLGPWVIGVMTTAPDVRAEALVYLPWMAAAPLVGLAAWMLDGVFIGATRTREMRNAMIQSIAVYAVAMAVLVPVAGNHGLWAALLISYVARALTLLRHYPALEAAARPG